MNASHNPCIVRILLPLCCTILVMDEILKVVVGGIVREHDVGRCVSVLMAFP